jgi:uncharacterized protein YkwD
MALRSARIVPLALILALAIGLPAWASHPSPVSASSESSMADTILARMNADRASLGLVPLRLDVRLAGLATRRAGWMAATGQLSHDSSGMSLIDAITTAGVKAPYLGGEAIGVTNAPPGPDAVRLVYDLWRTSPEHWDLMMSRDFNYVGVGVVRNDASGDTYESLVFAEAPDITGPVVRITGSGHTGGTVFFTWAGRDNPLQTHTAGLRDFDVQYRVDGGPWSTIRTHTTTTRLILANRPAGHVYSVRVRDRDRRNNLSPWSVIRTVRV